MRCRSWKSFSIATDKGDHGVAIIVQKFGGTSVRGAEQRHQVTRWVEAAIEEGHTPLVVVSAMGRFGDPYATDTLLHLIHEFPETPAAERDLLLGTGEILSAVVMAGHLRKFGIDAVALTGGQAGIVTDDHFGDAEITDLDPDVLMAHLNAGHVPVVAGFQGVAPDGRLTTLGRGASDTTAVALGAALQATVVEIFTDVDGVKTADPRIVPDARTIRELDYDEVFQLANLGARVIHPRAVELARKYSVRVRIRSTFSESPGTLMTTGRRVLDPWAHRDPDRAVTGVTQSAELVQFLVDAPVAGAQNWTFQLFDLLGERGVSVDLINLFPDRVYFCVPSPLKDPTLKVLQDLELSYQLFEDRAKVSIVGSAIQGLPGVVGRVMGALSRESIEILQSSDSHSTITLLLRRQDMERAVQALHQQFGLSEEVPLP